MTRQLRKLQAFPEMPATYTTQSMINLLFDSQDLISGHTKNKYRIKSKATGEYLYAAADYWAHDSERRRVFTWTDKGSDPSSEENSKEIGK